MSKDIDSASWTGSEGDHKGPTLMEMIDKYVPVATHASVKAMSLSYEAEITALLRRYHALVQQYEAACEHMHELQKEAASPVIAGKIATLYPIFSSSAASIAVPHGFNLDERQHTFSAACAELRRAFERELPARIEDAYRRMCMASSALSRT